MDFDERRGLNTQSDFFRVKVDKNGFVDGLGYVDDPHNQDFIQKVENGLVEVIRDSKGKITEVIFTKKYLQQKELERQRILAKKSEEIKNVLEKDIEKEKNEIVKNGLKQQLVDFLERNNLQERFNLEKIISDFSEKNVHRCILFDKEKNSVFTAVGNLDRIKKIILSHVGNIILEEGKEEWKEANA